MYKRKTRDVYSIDGLYYGVWSLECNEYSYHEARETIKCYLENMPGVVFRIRKHREKIETC